MIEHKLVRREKELPNGDVEIALEEFWKDWRRVAVIGETVHKETKNFVFKPADADVEAYDFDDPADLSFTMKIDYSEQ